MASAMSSFLALASKRNQSLLRCEMASLGMMSIVDHSGFVQDSDQTRGIFERRETVLSL